MVTRTHGESGKITERQNEERKETRTSIQVLWPDVKTNIRLMQVPRNTDQYYVPYLSVTDPLSFLSHQVSFNLFPEDMEL